MSYECLKCSCDSVCSCSTDSILNEILSELREIRKAGDTYNDAKEKLNLAWLDLMSELKTIRQVLLRSEF